MSASIAIAKDRQTGLLYHIDAVDKLQKQIFVCCGCNQSLIVVKSLKRKKDWHFRHNEISDIEICRSKALHDFAVQVILQHRDIDISNKLKINYSNPLPEFSFHNIRSDVAVNYNNETVHFEVYVTHKLDEDKKSIYRNNKIKCVEIDLSGTKYLTASPTEIKNTVLSSVRNKEIIFWEDTVLTHQNVMQKETWIDKFLAFALVAFILLLVRFFYNLLFRKK